MTYDPGRHNRQSIRLPEYDYRSPGAYFVTICVANRRCLFGAVVGNQMQTNDYGDVVAEEWQRTATVRDRVVVDTFVVMPNHTHGVIIITDPPDDADDDPSDRSSSVSNDDAGNTRGRGSSAMNPYHGENPNRTFGGAIAGSLSTIMRQFKSMVTKRINRLRDTRGATCGNAISTNTWCVIGTHCSGFDDTFAGIRHNGIPTGSIPIRQAMHNDTH